MSHSLFYAILTEAGSLGCCQRSRLFCARPSCDQVALWAIKAKKKKKMEKEIKQRGFWEDLWQQRSRPGPNPEEVVVRLWSHCCRTGNSCPPAWCHNFHAISYSANTDHHTRWVHTYRPDDVTKKLTWFFICNATDVLVMALDYCRLNPVMCKDCPLGDILQCTVALSELI